MSDEARLERLRSPLIGNCGQCGALLPMQDELHGRWWRYCIDCGADLGEPVAPAWVEQLASDILANKGIYQDAEEACEDIARELRERCKR